MNQIKANSLINYLNELFPQKHAAEWDKVGLQIEEVYNLESQDMIGHVIVCLDVTLEVIQYAIDNKSNFIISRHPFFFEDFEEELKNPAKAKMHKLLVENEIQVFSIHTNYDNSDNQNIIKLIETQFNIKEIKKVGNTNEGYKIKLLREKPIASIIDKLKTIFGKQQVLLTKKTDIEKLVDKIYLTPGAGASTMVEQQLENTLFVTGEAKWNQWLYADQNNIDMITLGHYMENYFIDDIEAKLLKTFGDELRVTSYDIKNTFIIL